VVQIEDASDPRGRARVLCAGWALPVSDRLRRHLSELAAIQRYRQARKSKRSGPNGTPPPRAAGRPRR
jgi:hypothetical protein